MKVGNHDVEAMLGQLTFRLLQSVRRAYYVTSAPQNRPHNLQHRRIVVHQQDTSLTRGSCRSLATRNFRLGRRLKRKLNRERGTVRLFVPTRDRPAMLGDDPVTNTQP